MKLEVQTAGGGLAAEVSLPAITLQQADILQKRLHLPSSQRIEDESPGQPSPEKKLGWKELIITASTSNGLGVVFLGATALISQAEQSFPGLNIYEMLQHSLSGYANKGILGWVVVVLLLLIMAWLLSMLGTVLSLGGFVLTREEDRLVVHRGLIEKKQVSIPLKRIQAVKMVEGVLRQPFGLITLHVVSAGHGDKSRGDVVLFPLLPKKDLEEFLQYIRSDVSTICVGMAASMGAFLLAAGQKGKRFALPNAEVMIHQPLGGMQGQATDIEIHARRLIAMKESLNRILAERTGQKLEKIQKDVERDYFMTAKEAMEYGIIDEVISHPKKADKK